MIRFCYGCFYLLILVGYTQANIFYVRPASSGISDGHSWQNAYTEIGQALAAAQSGDQVWVAEGNYRESTLIGKPGIQLYGGFAGHERSPEERNGQNHTAVLYGESFQAIHGPFVLDGFSITGRKTAAIQAYASDILFRNCRFFDNRGDQAGSVNCRPDSTVGFLNCLFQKNDSNVASAVLVNHATAQFVQCVFLENGTPSEEKPQSYTTVGGSKSSTLLIQECRFEKNRGNHSGGILLDEYSSMQSVSNEFIENRSSHSGGAILAIDSLLQIQRCRFALNQSSIYGGAVAALNSNTEIDSSFFNWNRTDGDDATGGALFFMNGSSEIKNGTIENNRAPIGGGAAFVQQKKSIVRNTTVRGNASSKFAGGIRCLEIKNLLLENNTIERNFSLEKGGGISIVDVNGAVLSGCRILQNMLRNQNNTGGGLFLSNSHAELEQCIFAKNEMHPWRSIGGGIGAHSSTLNVRFSQFYQNGAISGSDIGLRSDSRLDITNCTFVNLQRYNKNPILFSHLPQSPTSPSSSPLHMRNTVILGFKYAIIMDFKKEVTHHFELPESNLIDATNFQKNANDLVLNSYGFLDPAKGDFRLKPTSPLIDAGDTDAIGPLQPNDGNHDGSAAWDLGALEYRGKSQQ